MLIRLVTQFQSENRTLTAKKGTCNLAGEPANPGDFRSIASLGGRSAALGGHGRDNILVKLTILQWFQACPMSAQSCGHATQIRKSMETLTCR